VSIISDNKEEIISEILRLRQEVDIVITSGGVGPTHDDITIRSVADALGEEMVFHEEMANVLRTKMSAGDVNTSKLSQAQLKMATLPSSSKLMYLSTIEGDWPTLRCQNIFILPGIPQHFAKKIDAIANFLSSHSERSNSFKVILSVNESSIVPILNDIVGRHVSVSFGSYPFIGHPQVKTVITIESMSLVSLSKLVNASSLNLGKEEMDRNVKDALDSLVRTLEKQMPGSILRVENDDSTLFP
jgi:FAD synthetase